ncbi:tetratricopeptide repeat protein [Salimicrobium flavidum]|uniref:Tetratricopeptide repeat-containing protein n=1 Tax=Salimicrobium flavidum TaxID=570947 RepID=A0A1N7IZ54_9BACI|nr:hypothetical protein [Salimicrobium flavidum]SIS42350.1 hypothetical protein SAMN05421687_10324 [Salimicrobium flavidum]
MPGKEEARLLLCDCYLQLDLLEETEEKMMKWMPEGDNEEAWLHLMLRLCFDKAAFEEARPYALKLLSLDPHNPRYVWKYAQTYTLEKDFFSASRIASDYFSSHELDMKSIELMILLLFSSSFVGDIRLYEESKQTLIRFARRTEEENRTTILRALSKDMEMMAPVHYFYIDLLNVISEISGGKSKEAESWLGKMNDKKMKNVFYYPENRSKVLKEENDTALHENSHIREEPGKSFISGRGAFSPEDTKRDSRRKGAGRGSVSWSIAFGVVVALFIDFFFGFVSGMLWYYRAERIKNVWNGVGFAIFVTFYIFLFLINLE